MKHFVYWFVLIVVQVASCDVPAHSSRIMFVNKSEHKIVTSFLRSYPDTSIRENSFSTDCGVIAPYDSCLSQPQRITWDGELENNPKGYISFVLTDEDTLKKYGPNYVQDNYLILKRYDWNKDSLEKHHWRIVYP